MSVYIGRMARLVLLWYVRPIQWCGSRISLNRWLYKVVSQIYKNSYTTFYVVRPHWFGLNITDVYTAFYDKEILTRFLRAAILIRINISINNAFRSKQLHISNCLIGPRSGSICICAQNVGVTSQVFPMCLVNSRFVQINQYKIFGINIWAAIKALQYNLSRLGATHSFALAMSHAHAFAHITIEMIK